MQSSRRQFVICSTAMLATAFAAAPALSAKKSSGRAVNVRDYGAIGDGYTDDTRAFRMAFLQADEVFVPAGIYSVRQIAVPAGKRMVTDGLSTMFRQRPGEQSATPIVLVLGSNVTIGSFSAEGNIHSDPGEWMHVISVVADNRVGDLSDITIGDVVGTNIRGDVLYLGARPGFSLARVTAGNISGDNIYRNVVSITGTGAQGGQIRVDSVRGTRVGLFHFDIEPEIVPVTGVSVGSIRGQNVSVSGQSAEGRVSEVAMGALELSPEYGQVSVADPLNNQWVRPHALQLRNASNVSVEAFSALGFDGQAILFVESHISGMTLSLKSCQIEDCSRNDERNAYVVGQQDTSKIQIDQLRVSVPANKTALLFCNDCQVGSVEGTFGSGAGLLNSSPGAQIGSLNMSGADAVLARHTTDALFSGGSASVGTLGYSCDRLRFQDIVLTGSFGGGSSDQQHELIRTTLNNVYYEQEVFSPLQNV